MPVPDTDPESPPKTFVPPWRSRPGVSPPPPPPKTDAADTGTGTGGRRAFAPPPLAKDSTAASKRAVARVLLPVRACVNEPAAMLVDEEPSSDDQSRVAELRETFEPAAMLGDEEPSSDEQSRVAALREMFKRDDSKDESDLLTLPIDALHYSPAFTDPAAVASDPDVRRDVYHDVQFVDSEPTPASLERWSEASPRKKYLEEKHQGQKEQRTYGWGADSVASPSPTDEHSSDCWTVSPRQAYLQQRTAAVPPRVPSPAAITVATSATAPAAAVTFELCAEITEMAEATLPVHGTRGAPAESCDDATSLDKGVEQLDGLEVVDIRRSCSDEDGTSSASDETIANDPFAERESEELDKVAMCGMGIWTS